jgi:hypothetical protein
MTIRDITRSRWWMPAFCLFLGALIFGAFAIAGDPGQGAAAFGVMALVAAAFAFIRRSETLQGLGGPGRDERWAKIDVTATAISGSATILFVLGSWLYEIANGEDGNPWVAIAAVAVITYIIAVAFLRWRG